MDDGYVPHNPNPLNIEIGVSHRGTDEEDNLGDVQINDNFSMGHPSAALS